MSTAMYNALIANMNDTQIAVVIITVILIVILVVIADVFYVYGFWARDLFIKKYPEWIDHGRICQDHLDKYGKVNYKKLVLTNIAVLSILLFGFPLDVWQYHNMNQFEHQYNVVHAQRTLATQRQVSTVLRQRYGTSFVNAVITGPSAYSPPNLDVTVTLSGRPLDTQVILLFNPTDNVVLRHP